MEGFAMQMLMTLAYQLPVLLASVAAVAMLVWWAPPANGRTQALWGAIMLLVAGIVHALAGIAQSWRLSQSQDYTSVQSFIAALSALNMLFNLVASAGVVLLAWGACKAMQQARGGQ